MQAVVVKDKVWEGIGYVPHDAQKPVHDALDRHRVLAGGRRLGKSTTGARELEVEAYATYPLRTYLESVGKVRRFWVGGPDYTDCEKEFRILYNDLKRAGIPFDKPGTYNSPLSGNMAISLWDGKFIVECKSAIHHEAWDGEGLSGILLVEAAKMKERMWDEYVRPALADERGWSLSTSTPQGRNWFYRHWTWGQNPDFVDWASWRFPSWINSTVYPLGELDPEITKQRQEMSGEKFNQQVGASFTEYVGRVFKEFDEQIHVTDVKYNPNLPLFGAVDYGWTNPFVWLGVQIDPFDNVYVLGEYRVARRDIEDIASDLASTPFAGAADKFFPDPASPGDSSFLQKKLGIPFETDTGGTLKWRLELIRRAMKLYPEKAPYEKRSPKLFIDRSCIGNPLGDGGLIREMGEYRYADTKEEATRAAPEEPIDKDNHGPEALGRFFRGRFGGPESEKKDERAKIRRAKIAA